MASRSLCGLRGVLFPSRRQSRGSDLTLASNRSGTDPTARSASFLRPAILVVRSFTLGAYRDFRDVYPPSSRATITSCASGMITASPATSCARAFADEIERVRTFRAQRSPDCHHRRVRTWCAFSDRPRADAVTGRKRRVGMPSHEPRGRTVGIIEPLLRHCAFDPTLRRPCPEQGAPPAEVAPSRRRDPSRRQMVRPAARCAGHALRLDPPNRRFWNADTAPAPGASRTPARRNRHKPGSVLLFGGKPSVHDVRERCPRRTVERTPHV